MSRLICVFVICACFSSSLSSAQSIQIFGDRNNYTSMVGDPPGFCPLYVFAHPGGLGGLTAVQFWAPIPDCWQTATWIGDIWEFDVVIGSSQTGVSIGFGGCESSSQIYLGRINILSTEVPQSCCIYEILPEPGAPTGMVEFADCNAAKFTTERGGAVNVGPNNSETRIENPFPSDGASNQPINTVISWDTWTCCAVKMTHTAVYFGTTPDPPWAAMDIGTRYDPGMLMPATTYYWKSTVEFCQCDGASAISPVYSFTTEGTTAVEQSTWGAIKAMYK